MYSLAFPDMFSATGSRVNTVKDRDATVSNLELMLLSNKTSLFGDPYYGTDLKKVIFSKNSQITRDLIADEILTAIQTFMPQLQLTMNNIKVYSEGTTLYAEINCINKLDYTTDLFTIKLTETAEEA